MISSEFTRVFLSLIIFSCFALSHPLSADTLPTASPDPSAGSAHKAGEFVCIDDTKFMQFTSPTAFVVMSCPPGFCFTRKPPIKNPCIGKANAQRIDGI
ncbi:hypothetical protein BATDEDRAFT_87822 [Batrachochytrium dendrobatidis JAM81]|uniref:Chitin-binding type-2 domain-containing protein n=1 Tax=Batrachochytrium dendrobatidis (strain JAM81 / FGSC 10211) TaxID=684364 RepID=F4NZU7_BATDJ|nr:uncharacterized protein BATDEDRAFT_87822 [Batrachochytrium dendrobatidis JAM81]EGF81150.1 hypothetical protein BATDEDRAFT_87822 [Batrachochytrium dendrobatidis JAM81]KAJ8329797.1 hypothetical protein O5D80_001996 [Batrachochytrium dendrobatidis]KAK5669868.1 hypothetical protein QVD99_004244 [Batrachochytrium dendrobatidis]|eukprot:XP_006678103.1 hypothetical protein BATDEDRAFT_87822 [Batrachochytrium dendrobatidis JAM81]